MYSDVLVKIPSGTKNGTKMRLNGYGPNRKNDHIITINVHYPTGSELNELIKFLKKE
jgi:DnaJ-class molecular chaperone